MKKFLLSALALVAVIALAISGTVAYLTWEDDDTNVMTVGNVKIDQFEMERVVENGEWVLVDTSAVDPNYGYLEADKLQPFNDDKAAYPAVYQDGIVKWDDRTNNHQQIWNEAGAPGSNQLFDDSVKNVIDKFVFVKNIGSKDCYYRTYIAIECPDGLSEDTIHINFNGNSRFEQTRLGLFNDDEGVQYLVYEMLYKEVLQPDEVSRPSLLQVYLDPNTTNEDCALFGDTWEIVAISQACQTAGFEGAADAMSTLSTGSICDARIALDTSFGDPSASNESGVANVAAWVIKATAPTVDVWDSTVDTSWYNDTDTEFVIMTAEQLAGFGELVDGGNTFEGKTVKLGNNIDLKVMDENGEPICLDPIGSYRFDKSFKGTFDGQGHTISNLAQNTWALNNGYEYNDCGLGLFGAVEDGTVKNLTIDGAEISGETAICGTIAAVAHNAAFENITIKNANVADYQYYAGGIAGWASGEITVTDCVLDASATIGAQWGEFNNANGGIIGGASTSSQILIKDTIVSCRIDAFNDVTSAYEWYSYRRSGMLIGDTGQKNDPDGDDVGDAIAPNLTCENVTVIYGDWANYHYCQFNAESYPWVRVEAGTSTGAYSNPRYGNPTDADGNKVVDGTHAHNESEKHNELIVFDQLYGGASGHRYCTYGTATHDGVTVVYNNK